MDGKSLIGHLKARGPLPGLTALDPSVRWSARCGHKEMQRGGSEENNVFILTRPRDRDRERGSQGTGSTKWEKHGKDLCWGTGWATQKGVGNVTGAFECQWVIVGRLGRGT